MAAHPLESTPFPYTTLFRSCRGPKVVDLDDDVLVAEAAGDLTVLGEGALLAALRRSRGEHMRDIVTTIQRERSEEHTSELQSQSNLVCRLLLDKKKHLGNTF